MTGHFQLFSGGFQLLTGLFLKVMAGRHDMLSRGLQLLPGLLAGSLQMLSGGFGLFLKIMTSGFQHLFRMVQLLLRFFLKLLHLPVIFVVFHGLLFLCWTISAARRPLWPRRPDTLRQRSRSCRGRPAGQAPGRWAFWPAPANRIWRRSRPRGCHQTR